MGGWRGRRWQEFLHCDGLLRRRGIWRICGFIAGVRAFHSLLRFGAQSGSGRQAGKVQVVRAVIWTTCQGPRCYGVGSVIRSAGLGREP